MIIAHVPIKLLILKGNEKPKVKTVGNVWVPVISETGTLKSFSHYLFIDKREKPIVPSMTFLATVLRGDKFLKALNNKLLLFASRSERQVPIANSDTYTWGSAFSILM